MKNSNQKLVWQFLICIWVLLVVFMWLEILNDQKNQNQKIEIDFQEPSIQMANDINTKIKTISAVDKIFEYREMEAAYLESLESEPFFELTDEERYVVECIVAGEAGGELYEGKWAVAQCIWQACVNDELQPSEVKEHYQYAGWKENLKSESEQAYLDVKEVVSRVFDDGEMLIDDEILWFYAPKWCTSNWHESMRFITEIGGHRFFGRW